MRWRFDFMRRAPLWLGLSALVILVGVVSLATRGLNLSIDYTGGTQLQVRFEQEQTVASVREAIAEAAGAAPVVKALDPGDGTSGRDFVVQTARMGLEEREKLLADIEPALGAVEVLAVSEVSPVIRSELIRGALIAVLVAAALQIIYITFRFEFRFALAAVAALFHDSLITLGLVSILGVEVGPPFLAAVLTVIGYSVNDTIIIFDRIRENIRTGLKGETLPQLVNRSINETLTRSLNTVLTTLFAVVAILLLGGATTRDFATALLIGIVSGTYSSIFIASPLWLWWRAGARRAGRPVGVR